MEFKHVLAILLFFLIGFICANDVSTTQTDEKDSIVEELIKDITSCRGQARDPKHYYIKCRPDWADSDVAVFQSILIAFNLGKFERIDFVLSELQRLKKRYMEERPKM